MKLPIYKLHPQTMKLTAGRMMQKSMTNCKCNKTKLSDSSTEYIFVYILGFTTNTSYIFPEVHVHHLVYISKLNAVDKTASLFE